MENKFKVGQLVRHCSQRYDDPSFGIVLYMYDYYPGIAYRVYWFGKFMKKMGYSSDPTVSHRSEFLRKYER